MRAFVLTLLAAVGTLGCGGSGGYGEPLHGTVTYDGKPIPAGDVILEPNGTQGNSGPGTIGKIEEGRYTTPPGKGIVGGSYQITVRGYDGIASTAEEGIVDPGAPLFPAYQIEAEIPDNGWQFDIEVPKQ